MEGKIQFLLENIPELESESLARNQIERYDGDVYEAMLAIQEGMEEDGPPLQEEIGDAVRQE